MQVRIGCTLKLSFPCKKTIKFCFGKVSQNQYMKKKTNKQGFSKDLTSYESYFKQHSFLMVRILELHSELLYFNFFPCRVLKSMPLDYPRGKEIVRPLLREQPPIAPSEAAYGKRYRNLCVIKSRKVYVFLFLSSKNNFTIIRKTYLSCK